MCGRQVSVTAGTIFHRTRTPLRLGFAATWEMTSQKHGVSALGIQRSLGLGSYQTAWAMLHRYRKAMVRPGRERLAGWVEVDEAYLGGVEGGVFGRQTDTKAIVAIAVEIKNPKGFGRIRPQRVDDVSKDSLIPFIESAVEPGATVHTDGWQAYWTVPDHGYEHERTIMRGKHDPAHVLMPGVDRVASLLKRWLLGTHRGFIETRAPRRVPQRIHVPLQRRGSRRRGLLCYRLLEQAILADPITYPQPDRQPTPRAPTAHATEEIPAITGRRATAAQPNLTQIDTPLRD